MADILESADGGATVEFHLTGTREGKTLILGTRYQFIKGVLKCSEKDASRLARILVTYYGCKVVTPSSNKEAPKPEEPKRPAASK